jgi:type I restriction enzyme S subunit
LHHLDFITSGGRGWAKYYSTAGEQFIRSLDVQMNEVNDSQMIRVTPPNNAEVVEDRLRLSHDLVEAEGSVGIDLFSRLILYWISSRID